MADMDLSEALNQFDRTRANIELLQNLWHRYERHIPTSPVFGFDTPEVDRIRWEFSDVVKSLPAINGERLEVELPAIDDISQAMIEYREILDSEVDIYRALDDFQRLPKRELDRYQFMVLKARRVLVRKRIEQVIARVDHLLRSTVVIQGGREFPGRDEDWSLLIELIAELDRLRGDEPLSDTRLGDLNRHMHFAEPVDLRDIVETDWPSVRSALVDLVFRGEAMTVSVQDLGDLVQSEPTGSVTSRLPWERVGSEKFERLTFDVLRSAGSYENIEWLMNTNAPDRGRDLSAVRVIVDELSGVKRLDVIVQCRHWTDRSIGISELASLLEQVKLWSRQFHVVIIVTSGMFTQDAVDWREQRELQGKSPSVEFWPRSHLEHLLASRLALRSHYFHQE